MTIFNHYLRPGVFIPNISARYLSTTRKKYLPKVNRSFNASGKFSAQLVLQ